MDRSLNLNKLKNRKFILISSKEALKDVTPIDWNKEIKKSFEEVKSMQEGKIEKQTWEDFVKELTYVNTIKCLKIVISLYINLVKYQ